MSIAVPFDFRPEFQHFDQPRIAWFCVQTQHRHDEIAAICLKQDPEIEVFLPRIRYKRTTRFGAAVCSWLPPRALWEMLQAKSAQIWSSMESRR
jgi:hypothetical protein